MDYTNVLSRLLPEHSKLLAEYLTTHNLQNIIEHLDEILKQLYPATIIKSTIKHNETNQRIGIPFPPRVEYYVRISWGFKELVFHGHPPELIIQTAEKFNTFGVMIHELLVSNGFRQDYYDDYRNADNSIIIDVGNRKINDNIDIFMTLEDMLNKLKIMLKVEDMIKVRSNVV